MKTDEYNVEHVYNKTLLYISKSLMLGKTDHVGFVFWTGYAYFCLRKDKTLCTVVNKTIWFDAFMTAFV